MNSLAAFIIEKLKQEIRRNRSEKLMFRLDCFEDAEDYYQICTEMKDYCAHHHYCLTAKLAKRKYDEFLNDETNCSAAKLMIANNWIDTGDQMTAYRNSELPDDAKKLIVLMMGTESVEDQGGLEDFYAINPQIIEESLSGSYSRLIPEQFSKTFTNPKSLFDAFNLFYKTIFTFIERDVSRLCNQIDSWVSSELNANEVWEAMHLELPKVWGIPPIIDSMLPLVKGSTAKNYKALEKSCKFIQRKDYAKITATNYKKIITQFDQYREKNKRYAIKYPQGQLFTDYDSLKTGVLEFASGLHLDENKNRFLGTDYSIIDAILSEKPSTVVSLSATKLYGDPLHAFLTAFMASTSDADSEYDFVHFKINSVDIGIKGCVKEEQASVGSMYWNRICRFTGGLFEFIRMEDWQHDDDSLEIKFEPENIFSPQMSDYYIKTHFVNLKSTINHKVSFTVTVFSGKEKVGESYEFEWNITPDSDWLLAFETLDEFVNRNNNCVPFFAWDKINEAFRAKSKEEFIQIIDQASFSRNNCVDLQTVVASFDRMTYMNEISAFRKLGESFNTFVNDLNTKGFFGAISSSAPKLIQQYCEAGNCVCGKPASEERSKYLRCFLNAFIIAENKAPIFEEVSVSQCIVLPYHPAMLEKIIDRLVFIRQGMAEWYKQSQNDLTVERYTHALSRYSDLSYIHTSVDAFCNGSSFIDATKVYGYFSLYGEYKPQAGFIRMGSILQKEAVFDDDFRDNSFKQLNAEARMIRQVFENYCRTYGQSAEHLSLTFVNPFDLQTVVSSVTNFVLDHKKSIGNLISRLSVSLTILLPERNRGGRNYLAYWLDNMLDMDENVVISTYLDYWSNYSDIDTKIPENTDIVFFMDVMKDDEKSNITFAAVSSTENDDPLECRYPMVFKPQVSYTTTISRDIEITQSQFEAATTHTRVLSYCKDPHINYERKLIRKESIKSDLRKAISGAHQKAIWVVCIDDALDRKGVRDLRSNSKCPIIGFSTGAGSFGQLNLTITTRESVSQDIRERCANRLRMIFTTWDENKLIVASDTCIKNAEHLDGASVLLALNPSAYEINNFLAYLLIDRICAEQYKKDYVLIRLDSYRHWFERDTSSAIATSAENKIPDFLLLSFDLDQNNRLSIEAVVMESKISKMVHFNGHLEKACRQVEMGVKVLSEHFDPKSDAVERRYWYSQLYRAVNFVKDGSLNPDIAKMIDLIVDGKYRIKWSGAVYGFWVDSIKEDIETTPLALDGFTLAINNVGQNVIQHILLNKPREERLEFVSEIGAVEAIDEPESFLDFDVDDNIDADEDQDLIDDGTLDVIESSDGDLEKLEERSDQPNDVTDENRIIEAIQVPQRQIDSLEAALLLDSCIYMQDNQLNISRSAAMLSDRLRTLARNRGFHVDKSFRSPEGLMGRLSTLKRYIEGLDTTAPEVFKETVDLYKNDRDGFEARLKEAKRIIGELQETAEADVAEVSTPTPVNTTAEESEAESASVPLEKVRVLIGEDRKKQKVYWEYGHPKLGNRHILITGTSGQGKTYCIQTMLMELARQGISSVIFDYTDGFLPDKLEPEFSKILDDRIDQHVALMHKIPVNPFKQQTIDISGFGSIQENSSNVAGRFADIVTHVFGFGSQQHSALYQACKDGIDKYKDDMSFQILRGLLDSSSVKEASSALNKMKQFFDNDLFDTHNSLDWENIIKSNGRVTVFQLTGLDRQLQTIITEITLWDAWYSLTKFGNKDLPFVVVLDEAQNLSFKSNSPAEKILREGRKYGWSAWFATQFLKGALDSGEISNLQQAAERLYFKPSGEEASYTASQIADDKSGASEWLSVIKNMQKGQCIVQGDRILPSGQFGASKATLVNVSSFGDRI